MHVALVPGWLAMGGLQGVDNDGLVPVANTHYGEFRGCVAADHLQEIGLFDGFISFFSHKSFFVQIAEHLESVGH